MTDFYSDFRGVGAGGLTAEQYFYKQVFDAFKANTENQTLPFFNRDLNKIPRELSTGKIINNENAIALEQVASRHGYKSNLWIYGDELDKLQKAVGNLYCKKGSQPVVCLTKYFGSTHLNEQDLYIAEGGSGKRSSTCTTSTRSTNEASRKSSNTTRLRTRRTEDTRNQTTRRSSRTHGRTRSARATRSKMPASGHWRQASRAE